MIEARYTITFADYLRLMFEIAYRRWTYIIVTLLGIIQLPIILMMVVYPALYNQNSVNSAFMLIFFALLMPILLYFRSRAFYFGNTTFQNEIKVQFSKESIEFTDNKRTARISWDRIRKVVETKDWVIFYQTKYFFNFVPKSAFDSKDFSKLLSIIKDKLGAQAKLKS